MARRKASETRGGGADAPQDTGQPGTAELVDLSALSADAGSGADTGVPASNGAAGPGTIGTSGPTEPRAKRTYTKRSRPSRADTKQSIESLAGILAAAAGALSIVANKPWMALDEQEATAIAAGLARIAPYYLPDGGISEAVMDHVFAITQIGGVVIARRMRARIVGFPRAAETGDPTAADSGPSFEPDDAA